MSVTANDIEFRLSGGTLNSNPNDSLGAGISNEVISSGFLNNVWDSISGDESEAGDTEYRGIYIMNDNDSDTLYNVKIWISEEVSDSDVQIDIGIEEAIMQQIANESIAPTGISFSHPISESEALEIGNLGPNQYYGIWIKRIVSSGDTHFTSDGYTLTVKGETL